MEEVKTLIELPVVTEALSCYLGLYPDYRSPLEAPAIERDNTVPHVSDLIRLAQGNKAYSGPHLEGVGEFGFIWELASRPFMAQYADDLGYIFLPGTIVRERDGILGSLDGMMLGKVDGPHANQVVIVDSKLRYSKKDLQYPVRAQMRAYCLMTGGTQAILPVLRIVQRPLAVTLELITWTFDEDELAKNWETILSAKELWEPPESTFGEKEALSG